MQGTDKETREQIVKKFYDSVYQKEALREEIARRFKKNPKKLSKAAISIRNCYELFVEDAVVRKLAKEYNISETELDAILDEETEEYYRIISKVAKDCNISDIELDAILDEETEEFYKKEGL